MNKLGIANSPHVCNKQIKHTDLCYFHMQIDLPGLVGVSVLVWWFLVSVSVSILVLHSLLSVLALVSLCFGLINKPDYQIKSNQIKFIRHK